MTLFLTAHPSYTVLDFYTRIEERTTLSHARLITSQPDTSVASSSMPCGKFTAFLAKQLDLACFIHYFSPETGVDCR